MSGKRREPLSTECSMMWETPVSSGGGVVKQKANRFSCVRAGEVQDLAPRRRVPQEHALGPVLGERAARQDLEPGNPKAALSVLVMVS